MKLVQCKNGHFFDSEINSCCPVCGGEIDDGTERPEDGSAPSRRRSIENLVLPMFGIGNGEEDSVTLAMPIGGEEWSPVVGWIVCVDGNSRGRDYRIHPERNFVGRSGVMDISVFEDESIAMVDHCSIVYEPIEGEFMLVPGKEAATYYNEKLLTEYVVLKEGDKFTIGNSTFVFVPYCKGDVRW